MTLTRLFRRGGPEVAAAPGIGPAPVPPAASGPLRALGDSFSLRERLEGLPPAAGEETPAMLLIDLDGFGALNDRHGREVGDEVLRQTAVRLLAAAPADSSVFSVVGDQFAVVLHRATPDGAVAAARRLFQAVRQPFGPGGVDLQVGSSIAVVLLGAHRRADAVMRDADVALYAAKAAGGGHIYVYSAELDDWVASRRRDVDLLAAEVEYLRQQNRRLSESLLVDLPTGLPNIALFEADHAQLDARRRRAGDPYAVMIADVDWFYDHAERVGPAAAEESLAVVASTVAGAVRPGDRAYRYGPDEFAVLMPGATGQEAVAAAEQIRLAVLNRAVAHPPNPWGVLTVTIGVVEGGFRHATTEDVVSEAAELLQAGKQGGRNRIVWPH